MSSVLEKPRINEYGLARFVLQFDPFIEMNDQQFFEFSNANKDVRIERNAQREVIIMPPTGWETGDQNSEINFQLRLWTKKDKTGKCADSSTGYVLPNSAIMSPDASWILKERLEKLSPDQRQKFLPIAPDFVIELRSYSDSLSKLKAKMEEYIENGVSLGWLIDSKERKVYVYRPNEKVKVLENPPEISGESILEGFTLDLKEIWD